MIGFQAKSGMQSFSPGWGTPELLEKTLVGRRELVDRLEELAIDGAGGPNKHQRLIVGVRGSGKTHVLRVLHNRLWANAELKERLLIVYLLEDELGVASFLDFVVRMLRAITRWYPENEQLAASLQEIYNLPSQFQEKNAVQLLLNATESKDVLIIMENLGITFDDVKGFGRNGQEKLRDLVQQHPRFMIFASSQALVEGTRDHDRPFYGFFKVIHLRRLTVEETMTLLVSIAAAQNNKDMVRFLRAPEGRARMRSIHRFTCGNHRLLVTFYEFLTADCLARLSELFLQALDPLKPYYQEQMRSLSAQQQKIVQYLSLQRTPCTVKNIARGCLAASNTISSQLKGLLDRNFLSRIQEGRESYYEVTEALFRICYEADLEQEGAPIRLFLDFLANLYTAQELQLRWRGFSLLASKFGNEGAVPFAVEAEYYRKAIPLANHDVASPLQGSRLGDFEEPDDIRTLFKEMEEAKAYREIVEFSKHLGEERDAFVLHTEATAYVHLGATEKARDAALEALKKDPDDVEAHIVLSELLSQQPENKEDAIKHARRARELSPDDPRPLASMGAAFGNAGDHTESIKNFELLNKEHPSHANGWRLTGLALKNLGRADDAEAAYRKALELDPKNASVLEHLGILVGNAGHHEEALNLFQRLNEAAGEYAAGWALTGQALENLTRTDDAEAAYRKALELDPKNTRALEWLGVLIHNDGRHEEALKLFGRLNEVAADYAEGWALTGRALEVSKRTEDAEAAYRKALELDPKNTRALEWLGVLIHNDGRHEEALKLFGRLNEVAADYAGGWALTGRALEILKRTDEAEAAYRTALELDPKNAVALERTGTLAGNSGRYEEALSLFERLNEAAADYGEGWALTGRALGILKRTEDAEASYRKALDLDLKNTKALEWLGVLIHNDGRHEEALKLFGRLNEVAADYAEGWALTGRALEVLKRTEDAEVAYRKTLELDPTNTKALERLGGLICDDGRHEETLGLFQRLNELAPKHTLGWLLVGYALQNLKRTEDAEAAYRKTLELDPKNTRALEWLGILIYDDGRHEEALGLFERLNEVAPDHAVGWALTGWALENLKRTEDAQATYRRALNSDPKNRIALEQLGILAHNDSHHEEALSLFEQVSKLEPGDAEARGRVAVELEHLSREEEALKVFEDAIRLGANRANLLNSRGEARRILGKYEIAIADYEEALKVNPKAALPYFNIVSAWLALGNIERALECLPKALDAAREGEIVSEALIVQSFQENCQALFEHAPVSFFGSYLERSLLIIEKAGYMGQFEQSIPVVVFGLLKSRRSIDEQRFTSIIQAFEEVLAGKIEVRVAIRFLKVGVNYFKKNDRKALLTLTREERQTFCKELEIDDPGR